MIYKLGLIFTIINILFSLDDLLWDLYFYLGVFFKKIKKRPEITAEEIESVPPKMMALIIAAYHEEDVIEDVVENFFRSTHYSHSMLHLFIGTYPNDPDTNNAVKHLQQKYPNVHPVVHYLEGPSSKADNINNVLNHIGKFEKEQKIRFKFVVIHDAEDVIHPYEFLLENYLLEEHYAIQIPVFPLQEKPRLGNIFKNMVSGTYADEFAENHYRTMNMRNDIKAFVPSAGTGFAIKREVLESFGSSDIFPVGSLTEDYKLALEFRKRGFGLYYPLESLTRIDTDGKEVREFIATRSMFPRQYKAAVRQKARWTHGITMQSFKLREILFDKKLNFQTKYTFYKDWKAKYGNLLVLPGYLIFLYFIISIFIPLPPIFPKGTLSWHLMLVLTAMMIHRQATRFYAVKNVYGYRSAFIASLFPPLLPFRMVLGNIINMHATLVAWKNHLLGDRKKKEKKTKKKKIAWAKTDHEFLDEETLSRYHRRLGDILLEKYLLTPQQLKESIAKSKNDDKLLRTVLLEEDLVSETELVKAVCETLRVQYLDSELGNYINDVTAKHVELDEFYQYDLLPLFVFKDELVLIADIDYDVRKLEALFPDKKVHLVFSTSEHIDEMYHKSETNLFLQKKLNTLYDLIDKKIIDVRQALIALRYTNDDECIIDTLNHMGLLIE